MTQETEGLKLWREACHIYGGASIQGTCGEARAAAIIDAALAERDATISEQAKQIEALRDAIKNPPKHHYWGAGEPDCPREIKAGNGELWKLRCKVCGQDNPGDSLCIPIGED